MSGRPTALVVGTGSGCRIQVPALRAAGFEVAGLVGTDVARTAARAAANGVPGAFVDLGQAIAATGAGAVAISTPPTTHHAVTLAAIRHSCHTLCEKPFAASAAEALTMMQAAQRSSGVHLVGHEFRFVPQRALVARMIAAGAIGRPRLFAVVQFNSYVAQFAGDMPGWWFDPGAAGGWLGASGSHAIDQIRSELGEIDTVSAVLPHVLTEMVEDSFIVRMRLVGGAEGTVQQTGGSLGPPAELFRVVGSDGTIWTEGGAVHLADREGTRVLEVPPDLLLPDAAASTDPRQQSAEWQRLAAVEVQPYAQLCRHWRAAIDGDQSPSPAVPATFADGLAELRVIEAIRASARAGGTVVAVGR